VWSQEVQKRGGAKTNKCSEPKKNAKTRATDRWNRPTTARTFKKYLILWFVTGVAETAVDGVRRMGRRKIVFIDARAKKWNKKS